MQPLPGSPVQVIGPVPCNDSHRNVEDLVVWELSKKQLLTLALFPLHMEIPTKGEEFLRGEGDFREKAEFSLSWALHTLSPTLDSGPLFTWPALPPQGAPSFRAQCKSSTPGSLPG